MRLIATFSFHFSVLALMFTLMASLSGITIHPMESKVFTDPLFFAENGVFSSLCVYDTVNSDV